MGLLDYYKQFDDMGESEFNAMLRERRAQEKALALEQVPMLDLSARNGPSCRTPRSWAHRSTRLAGA